MSLKIWLPLNGDLRNLGCSSINLTNEATFSTNGKIGSQCLNSQIGWFNVPEMDNKKQMSFTYWVKINEGTSTNWLDTFSWYSTDGTTSHRSRQEFYYYNTGVNKDIEAMTTGVWYYNSSNSGLTQRKINQWYHYAFTIDYSAGISKFYVDGVLFNTTTNINTTHYIRPGNNQFLLRETALNSSINDFRLYDHCLSDAEVHEIAQGLVLHYKLDNSNPNLALGSNQLNLSQSKTNINWGKRGAINLIRKYGFTVAQGTASWAGASCWANSLNLQVGQTYTISCMGYTNTNTNTNANLSFYPMMYNSFGTRDTSSTLSISVMGGSYSDANSKLITKLTAKPTLYWTSFVWNQTMADIITNGGSIELSLQVSGTFNTGDKHCIYAPKIEQGDAPTGWRGTLSEEGLTNDIIIDNSGYGHHGTIVNETIYSLDTPRYTQSINLKNTNSMINCGRGGMVTDAITVNLWYKYSTWGPPVSCTENGGWNFEYNPVRFPVYISGVGYKIAAATAQPIANTWHMVTGVYDRIKQKVKIYINGEKSSELDTGSSNIISYNSNNVIWLGAEATSSNTTANNGMVGLISDFRIYCTPLLDNDIKLLYNVSNRIDNLGEIHNFELDEKDNNLLAGTIITSAYTNKTIPYTKYNSNGEMYFDTNSTSAGSDYISISPTGHTYYYDFDISVNAGNQFYIGFERFDIDKTSRSNAATVYIYNTKSSTDVNHKHIFGTVDLSTDGVNPCAFIALRILNGWSGTNSGVTGTATIHSMSLREISTIQNPKLYKNGILSTSEFKEYQKASFYKNGFIEATEFIEM